MSRSVTRVDKSLNRDLKNFGCGQAKHCLCFQMIAAFGSSYRCTAIQCGAAEGCDLFSFTQMYLISKYCSGLSDLPPAGLARLIGSLSFRVR